MLVLMCGPPTPAPPHEGEGAPLASVPSFREVMRANGPLANEATKQADMKMLQLFCQHPYVAPFQKQQLVAYDLITLW
jgi:hypothetical protein